MRARRSPFAALLLLLPCALFSQALAQERGLGERPPTLEEQAYIDSVYRQVSYVPPNDLARARVAQEIAEARARAQLPPALDALPTMVDNSTLKYFPPIRSQGSQGSCTCWAACYYYGTFTQAMDEDYDVSGGDNNLICSPAFMYPLVNGGTDCGANTQYVMARLSDVGASSWALTPYSAGDWTSWPSEAAWVDALKNRTRSAYAIDGSTAEGLDAIKQILANGSLATTHFTVYSTWYSDYPADRPGINNGVYYAPSSYAVGAHAVTLVGYDDAKSYLDHRDGQTHYGAFLLANSWGSWWGTTNSTNAGGKGFFWVAYPMFLDATFGPSAYCTDDRPDYRPALYAVVGINHPRRWDVRLRAGVSGTSEWRSYDAIFDSGGPTAVADDKRIAIDMTDGIPYFPGGGESPLLSTQLYVWDHSLYEATITSADFHADLDGDGVYFVYPSTDPVVSVHPGTWGYARTTIAGHGFEVIAREPTPATVSSEGTAVLYADYADSLGHGAINWAWHDNGAGGVFLPSSAVRGPAYTAPENASGADIVITLTVTATCDGPGNITDSDSTTLTVLSAGQQRFTDLGAYYNFPSTIGAAWGDYDKDGYADLFLGGVWENHRCLLLHNNGDGTFSDVTAAMGLPTTYTEDWGCAWGDYDNDGDLDLIVTRGNSPISLYRNDGAVFTDVGATAGFVYQATARGASWGDYDADNWLDLYICYELSNWSRLYRNNHDGAFTEVTNAAGMEFSPAGLAVSAAWADYDSDGQLDLLVARLRNGSQSPVRLYHNNGNGTFYDWAAVAEIQEAANCAGVAWGDYDNDGLLDIYLTSAHPRPQWLFHNNGDRTFTNMFESTSIADWSIESRGVAWADYQNDGLLDYAVANAEWYPFLFHNNGDGTFTDRAATTGMNPYRRSTTASWGDLDRDGRMDLFMGANDNYSCLFHNTGPAGNYLRVRALTDRDGDTSDVNTAEDRDALGARVEVNLDNDPTFPPGRTLLRVIDGGSSFCGQNEPVAHFGVGLAQVVAVRVGFPDGSIVWQTDVAVNQEIAVGDVSHELGTVRGTVTDLLSGKPAVGERVSCAFLSTLTAADGSYAVPRVPAGAGYTVRAGGVKREYSQVTDVTVAPAGTTFVDLFVMPLGYGTLRGAVTDAEVPGPIAGATVSCGMPSLTNETGGYLFYVPVGFGYTVSASAQGYVTREQPGVTIAGGQLLQLDFALPRMRAGQIQGVVTNAKTQQPIAGAALKARYGVELAGWYQVVSGSGGAYSFDSVPTHNTYTLTASATGFYEKWCDPVTVTEGTITQLDIALSPEFPDVPRGHWAYAQVGACVYAGIVAGYPDGTYRPGVAVTRDQMTVYTARALAGGDANVPTGPAVPTFPDVPTDYWTYKYTEYAVAHGIVFGYEDRTFRPTVPVDRGQMAVFVARAIAIPVGEAGLVGYSPPETPTFPDVLPSFWAYKYVEYIAGAQVTGGYPDGTYRPTTICTRDQMAVYMARAFHLLP